MGKYYLEKLASLFSAPLYYSQLHLLTKPYYGGRGQILMFHRVIPSGNSLRIHNHKSLEVTPEYLDWLIRFFKAQDYQFISLDELDRMKNPSERDRKFVIFTFDDGYVDNYEHAYPIFKKHNVPFTIYVTTGLPDSTVILWWYLLEDVIINSVIVEIDADGIRHAFRTETIKEKEMTFEKIRAWFAVADQPRQSILLESLFKDDKEEITKRAKSLSLSWQQIIELSRDPLVTIGSHTVNHLPLNSLSAEQSTFEIHESKKIIESHIGKEVRHFCYPLGSYGNKEIEILSKSTYASATTVKMANIFGDSLMHPFSLPRIMINSLTTEKILTLQINGLLPAIRNKFKRVVI